jgi:hypothetical protein
MKAIIRTALLASLFFLPSSALALSALGEETNKFNCVGANRLGDTWAFNFCPTNRLDRKFKWVTVDFNGKTHIGDPPVIL